MKTILKLILITVFLHAGAFAVFAQGEQLEREIRIAERILEEIFTTQTDAPLLRTGNAGRVQAEYLPGTGVHFKIGHNRSPRLIHARPGERDGADDNKTTPITSDWVEARMLEYFTGYAGQLRGLSAREQVRITYGLHGDNQRFVFFSPQNSERTAVEIPRITMWASAADVKNFADGNLSEAQFSDRISGFDLTNTEEKKDLNIFASVLETALNSTGSEKLRVNRKPAYEYLPGLGVHFHLNAGTGRGHEFIFFQNNANTPANFSVELGDIVLRSPKIEFEMDSLRVSMQRLTDSLRVNSEELRIQAEELRRHAEVARETAQEFQSRFEFSFAEKDTVDLSGEVQEFIEQLKGVISDYGSTLQSLGDNELLMITVNWGGRNPTLPERTHIRITKRDLTSGSEPDIQEISRR